MFYMRIFEDFFDDIDDNELITNDDNDIYNSSDYEFEMVIEYISPLFDNTSVYDRFQKYDYNDINTKECVNSTINLYRRICTIEDVLNISDNYNTNVVIKAFNMPSKSLKCDHKIESAEELKDYILSINDGASYNDSLREIVISASIKFNIKNNYTYNKLCQDIKKLYNILIPVIKEYSIYYSINFHKKVNDDNVIGLNFSNYEYPKQNNINKLYTLLTDNNYDNESGYDETINTLKDRSRRRDIRMLYNIEKYNDKIAPQYNIRFGGFTTNSCSPDYFGYYVLYIEPKENYEYAYNKCSIDKFIKYNIFDRLKRNDYDNFGYGHTLYKELYLRVMVIISDVELFSRVCIEDPMFRQTETLYYSTYNKNTKQTLNFEIIYLNSDYEVISDDLFVKDQLGIDYYGLYQRAQKLKSKFIK